MMDKTARVIRVAKQYGWEGYKEENGEEVALVSNRNGGEEEITIIWNGAKFLSAKYVLEGVKELNLPTALEAMRYMASDPDYSPPKTRGRRPKAEVAVEALMQREELPFELDASDVEIIKALRGKTITWVNTFDDSVETGVVPPRYRVTLPDKRKVWRTNRNISMSTSEAGKRIFTWPDRSGFRSIGLDQIIRVH